MRKKIIVQVSLTALFAAVLAAGCYIHPATVSVSGYIEPEPIVISMPPPPPPQLEVVYVPAPNPSYVWIEGSWSWRGHAWFWVTPYWAPPHPGYFWVPPVFNTHGEGTVYVEGHWKPHHGSHPSKTTYVEGTPVPPPGSHLTATPPSGGTTVIATPAMPGGPAKPKHITITGASQGTLKASPAIKHTPAGVTTPAKFKLAHSTGFTGTPGTSPGSGKIKQKKPPAFPKISPKPKIKPLPAGGKGKFHVK